MQTLSIYSIFNKSNVISHSDGVKLYSLLRNSSVGDIIVVSFKDIERASTGFLNASIGRLVLKNPDFYDKIKFIDATEMIEKKIFAVLNTSRISEKYDTLVDNAFA